MNRTASLFGLVAVIGLTIAVGALAPAAAATIDPLGAWLSGGAEPLAPWLSGGIAIGGLIVNAGTLSNLFTGYKANFSAGLGMAPSQRALVAMTVPSTTGVEEYPWLGQMPGMRKWVGDRVIHQLGLHDFRIKNEPWEDSIAVPRTYIEDDKYGIFAPMFTEMGRATAAHPEELVWGLLKNGFSERCYDGQYFFDTDHPVIQADGSVGSVSNSGGGAGTPWFLADLSRAIKPIIFQDRKKPQFVSLTSPTDPNVFNRAEFVYGVDARYNVGFGLWQMAFGSRQALTHENYAAARAALSTMKGDHGRPLGLTPTHLVVPGNLEGVARKILINETVTGGESNEWKGTAQLVVVPWLS